MKANEVPEKIIHNGIEYYRVDIIEEIIVDSKIFVKKDAFIEKARKWFEKQNEWVGLDGTRHCDLDEDEFENFKNYMKNE